MTWEEKVRALEGAVLVEEFEGRRADLRLTLKGVAFAAAYRVGLLIGREKAFEHLWHSARAAGVLP